MGTADIVSKNLTIPTLPEVVARVQRLVEDPAIGTREIGAVVAEDAPLAAKVLRVANSAYYGLHTRCMSTEQATTVLGVRVLRNIVTQVSVMQAFEHLRDEWGERVEQLWQHAAHTAQLCAFVGDRVKGSHHYNSSEYHACGLLHDVGKVVMLDGLGAQYMDALDAADKAGHAPHVEEKRRFEYDHADVGAVLASRWDLPKAMAHAIQHHHGTPGQVQEDPLITVVAACDRLVHATDKDEDALYEAFDADVMRVLGLLKNDLREIQEYAATLGDDAEDESWHDDPWDN